ncbi:microtubule-associated protein tau [Zerene cesonia]|uniref:microtubule-associated protein tau n=1 Tax=Zerene cesonia TaxID=33412 RepID=UPI0018E5951F|nr:microtubule-associated protein tau [Zerene cesonia]
MDQTLNNNVSRPLVENRSPGVQNGGESTLPNPPFVRPPLTRNDSRSAFPSPSPRPAAPQLQQRPQFQPGGPVTNSPQLGPRPGTPVPRGPISGTPGPQPIRPQAPYLRPGGPQSINPQQGPRPQQGPTQPSQRPPVPNNLQFGPRQPPQFGSASTPEGARPNINSQLNGSSKQNPAQNTGQLSRQPSQGSLNNTDSSQSYQSKPVNLDNQNNSNENQNINKPESNNEISGAGKARSYSIAAAPGAPSPLEMDDDRRKSVSAVSGRIDEIGARNLGLGQIQEIRGSKDNVLGSRESVRSEASNEGTKDITDRPESRLAASKMTESFMGSLSNLSNKKKTDDDDDVVLQNNLGVGKMESIQNKTNLSDRSPSLTRSDDSPEPKNISQNSVLSNKSQSVTPEPQRPKTPKIEIKQDTNMETKKSASPATPNRPVSKSPLLESKSPLPDSKSPTQLKKKPGELNTAGQAPVDSKRSTPRKIVSAPKSRPKDGDNDSGVDESTQGNDLNGSPGSPNKTLPSKLPTKEKSSSSLKPSLSRSSSKSATAKTPENPPPSEKKKVPMNKIQVGNAPSPNIKTVKSKIGSLENTTYKPGGGKVKIENRKLDFNNVTPKIAAKNDAYTPSGGSKKITTTKLEWNAKSKIGSLQNTSYKPGGGDKKIETVKLDFKEKAKPKVASTVNITHKPGGGAVKIENQKLEFKAQSKVGSLDNVKHKPGGGDIKIFDDKDYIKQIGGQSPLPNSHGQSRQESDFYMEEWEEDRPLSRSRSARFSRTPRTPRALSPRKPPDDRFLRSSVRNKSRPVSARDPPPMTCSRRSSITHRPAFTIY